MQTSVFSEYLAELLKHSLILDTGQPDQFIRLQHLEDRILKAHIDGRITGEETQALHTIARKLHRDYRTALHLD